MFFNVILSYEFADAVVQASRYFFSQFFYFLRIKESSLFDFFRGILTFKCFNIREKILISEIFNPRKISQERLGY